MWSFQREKNSQASLFQWQTGKPSNHWDFQCVLTVLDPLKQSGKYRFWERDGALEPRKTMVPIHQWRLLSQMTLDCVFFTWFLLKSANKYKQTNKQATNRTHKQETQCVSRAIRSGQQLGCGSFALFSSHFRKPKLLKFGPTISKKIQCMPTCIHAHMKLKP